MRKILISCGAACGRRFIHGRLCAGQRRGGAGGGDAGQVDQQSPRPASRSRCRRENVEVAASIFDIAPGATLPVHKHPFPRYGYVLAGTLKVTNVDTGKSDMFKAGDFIVEMIDQWHQGSNIGADPVKLLVIDQIEAGAQATVLRQ